MFSGLDSADKGISALGENFVSTLNVVKLLARIFMMLYRLFLMLDIL